MCSAAKVKARLSRSLRKVCLTIFMPYIKVCSTAQLPPGRSHCFELDGKCIAVFNVAGTYFAFDNYCTHERAPLSEGRVLTDEKGRRVVECPMHHAHFNILTGEPTALPAMDPIEVYPVRVEGDEVQVYVDGSAES